MPTPENALERLLAELFDPPDLRRFLRRHVGDEVVDVLPGARENKEEVTHQAVRRLKQRGEIDEAFFLALEHAFPKRAADLAEVAGHWGVSPSEAPTPSTSRKSAPRDESEPTEALPPIHVLPESRYHLDRILQWQDVLHRCESKGHQAFLIYGPRAQHIGDFTRRVQARLNRAVETGTHRIRTLSAGPDGEVRPRTPEEWEQRFALALGGGRPVQALERAARREPVFLFVGELAFQELTSSQDEVDAFARFLSQKLSDILAEARPRHPLRLYVAVEEPEPLWPGLARWVLASMRRQLRIQGRPLLNLSVAPGPWARQLRAAFQGLHEAGLMTYAHGEGVSYPRWDPDVRGYVTDLGLRPGPDWWARLQRSHATHQADGERFREFCEDLDRLLRQLQRTRRDA
ncbi:MAG: hypothetical protein H6739_19560 [Alphaproteobacteria bacterium]|nr:hypothetical protein [Alphaproteobacteria bacterium]